MMLQGKAIVITGSGKGIGAACARGAARQGASVVVNDVDDSAHETAAAINAEGGTAVACVANVADWDEAGRLIEHCLSNFGGIDGLVNNAALYYLETLQDFQPARARGMVEVNVLGPLHCTGHAIGPMLRRGSGSIVNVVSGAQMGMPQMGVYGATKGAVASMVYTWALELAGTGVRVNALSPFGRTTIGGLTEEHLKDPDIARRYAQIQPPEANSPVLEYLLSDRASAVNGQLVRIDKGEIHLYTHPALLLPPVYREQWTAETVADAFESEFRDRQVPCGVLGMTGLPVELQSGFWKRADG
ncbi:SDR family NAD(P)-dependent oxidoreductase [Haliea sp. E17]|uniref:SDR family NAD(P)-dependent oxidoreductase n=1 Tax=Haliea sp. E17 TaxID=3401576 RepID=UPI003AADE7AE